MVMKIRAVRRGCSTKNTAVTIKSAIVDMAAQCETSYKPHGLLQIMTASVRQVGSMDPRVFPSHIIPSDRDIRTG
jgi:hypothetical protein